MCSSTVHTRSRRSADNKTERAPEGWWVGWGKSRDKTFRLEIRSKGKLTPQGYLSVRCLSVDNRTRKRKHMSSSSSKEDIGSDQTFRTWRIVTEGGLRTNLTPRLDDSVLPPPQVDDNDQLCRASSALM